MPCRVGTKPRSPAWPHPGKAPKGWGISGGGLPSVAPARPLWGAASCLFDPPASQGHSAFTVSVTKVLRVFLTALQDRLGLCGLFRKAPCLS